jgi:hypothetical protein
MPINANRPQLWKADIQASVDMFNTWFIQFAPRAYQETRQHTTDQVKQALLLAEDMIGFSAATLRTHPEILPTLRMTTAPPLARDRLIGLSQVPRGLVDSLEKGHLPLRLGEPDLTDHLQRLAAVISRLVDVDIFPWLEQQTSPTEVERSRASTIVADRLCGAVANPIIRNAQERRQLALIESFLLERGYQKQPHPVSQPLTEMAVGTYSFRMNLVVGTEQPVNIPVDVVVQPRNPRPHRLPVLMEAKSAGDFTNTNKRRKEEATKIRQLRLVYGTEIQMILFLCGYFDSGYLGYEAAEGLDWIWEHRIDDLFQLNL